MAWLVSDDRVLATLEVADTAWRRGRGLLGRDRCDGAMLFPATRSVHTLGMRFRIDVAICTEDLEVIEVLTLSPNRLTRPRRRGRMVVEAPAGAFTRWGVGPGDRLEVRGG
jgi:uncharacterized membrane protein (UPF0127 family)